MDQLEQTVAQAGPGTQPSVRRGSPAATPGTCVVCGGAPGDAGKPSEDFRRCRRCHGQNYCSERCQRDHWEQEHKGVCISTPHPTAGREVDSGADAAVGTGLAGPAVADGRPRQAFKVAPQVPLVHDEAGHWWLGPCVVCGKEPGDAGKPSEDFRRCRRCHGQNYCSAWCQRDHWEREHKGTCISAPKPEGFRSEQQVVVIRDTHTPGGTEHLAGELVVFEKEDAYGWTYVRDARGSTHWLQSSALAAATRALGAAAQASTDIDSDAMHQMPDIAPANGNGASDKMRFRSEQQVVVIHDTHTPEGKLHLAGELVVFEKEDAHGWTSVRDASGMRCWLPSSALEAAVADGKSLPFSLESHEPARWWEDMHLVTCDDMAQLAVGPTAYRLIGDSGPVVVLLHGAFSFSYIFLDLAKRLKTASASSHFGQAQKRILLLDFLGRGRTAWPKDSPQCTVELLTLQVEQLLRYLDLGNEKVALVGHDMGCLVAASFAARNSDRILGLIALGPAGTMRQSLAIEKALQNTPFWENVDDKLGSMLEELHRVDFFDQDVTSPHSSLMSLHCAMIRWQMQNTKGYLSAVKSTLRFFPLRESARQDGLGLISDALLGKQEPASGLSVYRRLAIDAPQIVVMWGSQDALHPPKLGENSLREALPNADLVFALGGHAVLLERYLEVAHKVKVSLVTFFSKNETPPALQIRGMDAREEAVLRDRERVQAAEALLSCLKPPHYFPTVLRAFSKAQTLQMQGTIVEEIALIVLHHSRARLLQRSIQLCIEYDDIPTLVEALHNGRLYFLKSVQGYVPCHCQGCSRWAVEFDALEGYVESRRKVRTLQQVQHDLDGGSPHRHTSPAQSPGARGASTFDMSDSKVRRAAGHVVMGSAKLPDVDFDVEAAGALFDLIDVESVGVIRRHELMAFTSLLDSTPDDVNKILHVLDPNGSGVVGKGRFIALHASVIAPLVRSHPRVFELALSSCLRVAHRHYDFAQV